MMKLMELITLIQANWDLFLELMKFLEKAKGIVKGGDGAEEESPATGTLNTAGFSDEFPLLAAKCKEDGCTFDDLAAKAGCGNTSAACETECQNGFTNASPDGA